MPRPLTTFQCEFVEVDQIEPFLDRGRVKCDRCLYWGGRNRRPCIVPHDNAYTADLLEALAIAGIDVPADVGELTARYELHRAPVCGWCGGMDFDQEMDCMHCGGVGTYRMMIKVFAASVETIEETILIELREE